MDEEHTAAFLYFIKANITRVIITNVIYFGVFSIAFFVLFYFIFVDGTPDEPMVLITISIFIILVVGSGLLSNWLGYRIQRNMTTAIHKKWKIEYLSILQTREFRLKTKYNRAFYLCKMAIGAVPDCQIKEMDPKAGRISARRGNPWVRAPACKIEFYIKREKKKLTSVIVTSDLSSHMGLADKGANLKNIDYMMRYLDRHCSDVFEPVGFVVEETKITGQPLKGKKLKPDYLEDS